MHRAREGFLKKMPNHLLNDDQIRAHIVNGFTLVLCAFS